MAGLPVSDKVLMNQDPQFPRVLTRFDAALLIIGNMIGIGIFTTTGYYSQYVRSPLELFAIWFLVGIYVFCGALTYAELATRFPRSGGDYLFLSRAYHPLLGFLFGWSTFTVTYTGSIAAIAIGLAAYTLKLLPASVGSWQLPLPALGGAITPVKIVALGAVLLMTWINSRGIRQGSRFQNALTILGILTLLMFIFMGISSPHGDLAHYSPFFPKEFSAKEFSLLAVALVGVIFTYSGWTVLVYIAEEIKEPRRTLPFAMAVATAAVTLLYLMMNAVYLYAQPLSAMNHTIEIGYQTLRILMGENTSALFSAIIVLMVMSSLNATVLSGARIYYAMAREGRFFGWVNHLHATYRVPGRALWLQALWVALLIVVGSFDQLLTYAVFEMVLFSFLTGSALFRLRRIDTAESVAYKTWGYPYLPIFYLVTSAWLMINILLQKPVESLWGIVIILTGIPFYFYWRRTNAGRLKKKSTGKN